MDRLSAVLDGLISGLCLLTALTGLFEPLAGLPVAIFLGFVLGVLLGSSLAVAHRACGVRLTHALTADLILVLAGALLFAIRNPLGPWALLAYLAILIAPFLVGRGAREPSQPTRVARPAPPAPLPPRPRRRHQRPRARGRGRPRRRSRDRA